MYRWVLLNLNVDNMNSELIQNPVEIRCRSLMCWSACWIQLAKMKGFLLGIIYFFELSGRNLYCHSSDCKGVAAEVNEFEKKFLGSEFPRISGVKGPTAIAKALYWRCKASARKREFWLMDCSPLVFKLTQFYDSICEYCTCGSREPWGPRPLYNIFFF